MSLTEETLSETKDEDVNHDFKMNICGVEEDALIMKT